MNAESIPEGSSKDSSIINLPKPEIGGSVESGEVEISDSEITEKTREKILDIREKLSNQPEIADLLLSEYTKNIDEINKNKEELVQICNKMFSKEELRKDEIGQAMLEKINNLLMKGNESLKEAGQNEQKMIVEKIINDFKREMLAIKKEIAEFEKVAQGLNEKYKSLYFGPGVSEKEIDECNDEDDRWEMECMLEFEENFERYDSQRIKEIIETTETSITEFEQGEDYGSAYIRHLKEKEKSGKKLSEIDLSFIKMCGRDLIREKKLAIELKKILPYQIAFEKKFEKIIFGKEAADLPEELFDDIEQEIEESGPEKMPSEEKQIYLPVGISSNLPEWENILNGKKKMAKPMDIYGYMFWLNNQNKDAKLVICDQMQASNYESLYGKSHDEAIEATKKIGEKEKRFYQKIINTFGLDNIEIVDYESFVDEYGENFEKYKNLCESLSKDEIWKEAFLGMVQESVSEKDSKDEKDKYLPYATDELSWILAYDGIKVSHVNEARYDALAVIIKNVEKFAKENKIDIFNLEDQEKEKLKPIINGVIQCVRNILNTKKLNLENEKSKNSPEAQYYKKMHEVVGKIKKIKDIENIKIDKSKIEIDFISPANLGSRSFGRRSKGESGKTEDTIKFKEAYSTYFCKGGADMFLESDQVVASPKGHIGGKILTFEKDLQIKYVKEVIKPILTQYFKTLEKAPTEYFEQIKKTKEELLAECKDTQTLSELLKFIQRYIMEPTFSE